MRLLRLRTVLVATDLDTVSIPALESAARLATATGATLHVVHVVSEPDDMLARTGRSPKREQDVRSAIDRAHVETRDLKIHVIAGDPRTTIGPLANALGADVVVMGRHPEHAPGSGHIVGGTATAVIRDTIVPCLVVTRPLGLPIDRVLVAVDASETSRGALVVAASWASALRRRSESSVPTLTALHVDVGSPAKPEDQSAVDRELDALRQICGAWAAVSLTCVCIHDPDPVSAITGYSAEMDPGLVVLGTRALGRPTHPALGSVASALARRLSGAVLLVPPAVWHAYARDLVA